MLRSLYSGVSGMKNLQTKMDVVSNNIANVNTTGYKSSRVSFQDMVSQTMSNATAPTNNNGGINGKQIGLGVQTGSIDTSTGAGAPQSTGNPTDLYIGGEGYFVVRNNNGANYYTRDGSFKLDANGSLVNSNGLKVLGYATSGGAQVEGGNPGFNGTAAPITVAAQIGGQNYSNNSLAVDENGTVTAKYGSQTYVLGRVQLATFFNPGGLQKMGGNNYAATANSGQAVLGQAGENGSGNIQSGKLEMSNVDLSNEFTEMIIANRAYQANARSITTSDEMLQELINLKR